MPSESNPYFPFFKASACLGVDAGLLWLQNLRRLRELQLKIDVDAIKSIQDAATALGKADDLTTLLAQQPQLYGDQVGQAVQYWRDLMLMTKDNQAAMTKAFQRAMDSWVSGCSDAFEQSLKTQPENTPMETWLKGVSNAAALTIDAMTATTQGLNELTKAGAAVPPAMPTPSARVPKHH
ncbi:hypothetical protein PTE30175_00465 [Pandoraea terrae]|uniref:Phasin domain-containing protein n=1 Tax=Pandoraea terrae TaxID=1537710 RepID=A0A5E4S184_9BURK|nr:phasin family protein [Pandoraea terrae]VVD68903.1 hypothetical protein PTE30175_00465 [Pandoraea terrae]